MTLELTAVYKRVPDGYVAFVEELPGANTQGATLEDAREETGDVDVIRESSTLASDWNGGS